MTTKIGTLVVWVPGFVLQELQETELTLAVLEAAAKIKKLQQDSIVPVVFKILEKCGPEVFSGLFSPVDDHVTGSTTRGDSYAGTLDAGIDKVPAPR